MRKVTWVCFIVRYSTQLQFSNILKFVNYVFPFGDVLFSKLILNIFFL